jgi:hypothetical protein
MGATTAFDPKQTSSLDVTYAIRARDQEFVMRIWGIVVTGSCMAMVAARIVNEAIDLCRAR